MKEKFIIPGEFNVFIRSVPFLTLFKMSFGIIIELPFVGYLGEVNPFNIDVK